MNWIRDLEEKHEFATDYSIFTGSFSNPEMARKMMSSRTPTHELTNEEFDASTKKMLDQGRLLELEEKANKPLHRRKRKVIIDKE